MTKLRAPYVTAYSDEEFDLGFGFADGSGGPRLTYQDPRADDWMFNVLWPRQAPHVDGRPIYRQMHPLRQRECMLQRRCQVCRRSTLTPAGNLTWLLPGTVTSGLVCLSKPPVCVPCISDARGSCPHLRDAHTYISSDYEPRGIVGLVLTGFDPDFHEVSLADTESLAVSLAMALIVRVRDLTPVRLP